MIIKVYQPEYCKECGKLLCLGDRAERIPISLGEEEYDYYCISCIRQTKSKEDHKDDNQLELL